jgi:hypothetical protein
MDLIKTKKKDLYKMCVDPMTKMRMDILGLKFSLTLWTTHLMH